MTIYRTGRSADYQGAESRPPKRVYPLRSTDITAEAITQFERMARGLVPVCGEGSTVAWVTDDTLTEEQREWCRETARQIKREAELARIQRRAQEPTSRTTDQVEQAVAAVLARRPDAAAHEIRMITGIAHSRVLRTEAWQMAHLGRQVKE